MITKTITYVDFNGVKRTEEHLFHISKAEALELEMSEEGGMTAMIKQAVSIQSQPKIFKTFKKFVLTAYGEKSADGRRFIKSEEISTAFSQTGAYNALVMELTTDADKAADFFNSLINTMDIAENNAASTGVHAIAAVN